MISISKTSESNISNKRTYVHIVTIEFDHTSSTTAITPTKMDVLDIITANWALTEIILGQKNRKVNNNPTKINSPFKGSNK